MLSQHSIIRSKACSVYSTALAEVGDARSRELCFLLSQPSASWAASGNRNPSQNVTTCPWAQMSAKRKHHPTCPRCVKERCKKRYPQKRPNNKSQAPKGRHSGAAALRIAQAKTSTSLGGTNSQHGPQSEGDEVRSDSGSWMFCSFVIVKKCHTRRRCTACEHFKLQGW